VTGTGLRCRPARGAPRTGAHLLIIAGAQLMVVPGRDDREHALPSWAPTSTDADRHDVAINATRSHSVVCCCAAARGRHSRPAPQCSSWGGAVLLRQPARRAGQHVPLLLGGRVCRPRGAIASPTRCRWSPCRPRRQGTHRAFAVYAASRAPAQPCGSARRHPDRGTHLAVGAYVNVPIGSCWSPVRSSTCTRASGSRAASTSWARPCPVGGMVSLVYAFIHAARDGWNNAQTYPNSSRWPACCRRVVLVEAFVARAFR